MANLLVIDSEPTVRTVMKNILESSGHRVRVTGEFEEALEMCRTLEADLILTNVFLRGITGHDAMHRLKGEFPATPVLMVSGLPDDRVIAEWAGETGFDVFPKPFTCKSLLDKVQDILAHPGN